LEIKLNRLAEFGYQNQINIISNRKNSATNKAKAILGKSVMSGILKIEIGESLDSLKKLLGKQKTGKTKERLQALYWLQSGQSQTVHELALRLGHHRTTVSRWLSLYRTGGLNDLLNIKTSSGRSRKVSPEIENRLVSELSDPEGFASYQEVQVWLKIAWDVEMSYTGVHKLVRYRL
jgi:putative transposase